MPAPIMFKTPIPAINGPHGAPPSASPTPTSVVPAINGPHGAPPSASPTPASVVPAINGPHGAPPSISPTTLSLSASAPKFLQTAAQTVSHAQLTAGVTGSGVQAGLDAKGSDLHALLAGVSASLFAAGFSDVTQPVLASTPDVGASLHHGAAILEPDSLSQHGFLLGAGMTHSAPAG